MKLIYETPEIELNKYKFSDVLSVNPGYSSAASGEHGEIPEQDHTDNLGSEQDTWDPNDDDQW